MPQNDLPPGITPAMMGALPTATPQPTVAPQPSWLDRIINIFHPTAQTEHPMAPTNRLINRADDLEAQLDALQRRSSK